MRHTTSGRGARGRSAGLVGVRTAVAVIGAGTLVVGGASASSAQNGSGSVSRAAACVPSWTMYQHDVAHRGTGCSTLSVSSVPTLHPDWFASMPGAVTAEPVVAGNTVYAGDSSGLFHALSESTGASTWTFDMTTAAACYLDHANSSSDEHGGGFGAITSSASISPVIHADAAHPSNPTVYFGGGGTVFALDAATGSCDWAQDIDPGAPAAHVEIESSPVLDTAVNPPEVIVGSDDNTSPGIAVTGLYGFDAVTGSLLWRYEPERDVTLYPSEFGGSDALTLSCGDGTPNAQCNSINVPGIATNSTSTADACGDVWSSPILDAGIVDPGGVNGYQGNDSYGAAQSPPLTDPVWQPKQITASGRAARNGLVVFGTGNCEAESASYTHDDYAHAEGIFALDAVTGVRVWNWFEPANQYNTDSPNENGSGDDDFGSSPVLATVPASAFSGVDPCPVWGNDSRLVIEGSKSGYAYGLCESTGKEVWGVQAAQAGQLGPSLVGALGGFIGSPSLGSAGGRPAAFFDAAIFLPFANDGIRKPGDGQDSSAGCPGPDGTGIPLLPACPDPSVAGDPARLMSLMAIDVANGSVLWRAASSPSYAATSYVNGVVFAASTTQFSDVAYDADNGLELWRAPLGAAGASGNAIAGSRVFVGSGISEGKAGPSTLPPGSNGVWSFSTEMQPPDVTGMSSP